MKQVYSMSSLITVISLFLSVIWLSPALAAGAPTFASLGQLRAEGVMKIPGAMDIDLSGNLFVADTRGGLVHIFSPSGVLQRSLDLGTSGIGLAVTPDGTRLYATRMVSLSPPVSAVDIVDVASGSVVGSLTGSETTGAEFLFAGALDLDAAGNVFALDTGRLQVKIYNADGQFQSRFGGPGKNAGQFWQIGGMSINPAGQVVIADTSIENGKVQVFTVNPDLSVNAPVVYLKDSVANFGPLGLSKVKGLAFDALGRGYVLESFFAPYVRATDVNFTYLGAYEQVGSDVGQLDKVINIAFDRLNDRLFVSCDLGRIEVFGVDGGQNPDPNANHAPTLPSQQSPVAGSEVASLRPALVINNSTDADGDAVTYHLIINDENNVLVREMDAPAVAGATTTVVIDVDLLENTAYTWTVQASDGVDSSAVSAPANFVVNVTEEAPSVPELSAPVNAASISGLNALSWVASTDPDPNDLNITYLVELALDGAFAPVVAAESLTATELNLNTFAKYHDLVDGSVYSWRVTALDDAQTASAPSLTRQFVYDTTGLTITANMPDAVVSFSGNHAYAGQTIGSAPLDLRDFTPGSLSVVVTRVGFEPFVAQVTLAEGDNIDLYAVLVPAISVADLSTSRDGINGRTGLSVSGAAAPFAVDFDNDGDLDLLVGDNSGQLTLFANMQSAGRNRLFFDQGVSLGLSVMPGAVPFVADWNNDGRKDLLVGQADGAVKLFINTGLDEAPAFAQAGSDVQTVSGVLNAGSNAAPAVIDYNGDGKKDLLVGNASGQVLVFLNQGSDAAPVLAVPTIALTVSGGAVVPTPVDWDADGQQELLLTVAGAVTVYSKVGSEYQAGQSFADSSADFAAAFPIALEDSGKQLLAGQSNGQLAFLVGNNTELVASFPIALQAKVDELAALVADADPTLLADAVALGTLISAGDYAAVALAADDLSLALPAGAAQTSALELADLCK